MASPPMHPPTTVLSQENQDVLKFVFVEYEDRQVVLKNKGSVEALIEDAIRHFRLKSSFHPSDFRLYGAVRKGAKESELPEDGLAWLSDQSEVRLVKCIHITPTIKIEKKDEEVNHGAGVSNRRSGNQNSDGYDGHRDEDVRQLTLYRDPSTDEVNRRRLEKGKGKQKEKVDIREAKPKFGLAKDENVKTIVVIDDSSDDNDEKAEEVDKDREIRIATSTENVDGIQGSEDGGHYETNGRREPEPEAEAGGVVEEVPSPRKEKEVVQDARDRAGLEARWPTSRKTQSPGPSRPKRLPKRKELDHPSPAPSSKKCSHKNLARLRKEYKLPRTKKAISPGNERQKATIGESGLLQTWNKVTGVVMPINDKGRTLERYCDNFFYWIQVCLPDGSLREYPSYLFKPSERDRIKKDVEALITYLGTNEFTSHSTNWLDQFPSNSDVDAGYIFLYEWNNGEKVYVFGFIGDVLLDKDKKDSGLRIVAKACGETEFKEYCKPFLEDVIFHLDNDLPNWPQAWRVSDKREFVKYKPNRIEDEDVKGLHCL